MNALDAALRAVLVADTGAGGVNNATTGAIGGISQLISPQKTIIGGQLVPTPFPRVEFHELLDTALYTFRTLVGDHVYYQIKAVAVDGNSSGPVIAGALSERIRTLLTDPSIVIVDKTLLYCRFERSIPPYAEWDDVNSRHIFHKGGIYEVWIADTTQQILSSSDQVILSD